jgi:hypothetical protein
LNLRFNKTVSFGLLTGVAFVYILLRSAFVPISHDEAATFFHYIITADFLPFFAHWDANNHILNSALATFFYWVFDDSMIWLRIPNALSFLLYSYFIFKILERVESKWVWITGASALLFAWMPLEFFAQCRGYGMSLAFLVGGLFFYIQFLETNGTSSLSKAWLMMILAMLANMSLSNTYLILIGIGILALLFKQRYRKGSNVLTLVFLGVLPFVGFSYYAFEMKARGLLYYGSDDGFIALTVRTLNQYTFNSSSEILAILVTLIGAVASGYLIAISLKIKFENKAFFAGSFFAMLLLGNAMGVIALNMLLGVNYPEDRVGIYFIPLFIFSVIFFFDELSRKQKSLQYASLILFAFPIATLASVNLKEVAVWKEFPLDREAFNMVVTDSKNLDRLPIIGGDKLFKISWGYHNLRSGAETTPLIQRDESGLICDYQLCYGEECERFEKGFVTMWQNKDHGVRLLRNENPPSFAPLNLEGQAKESYSGTTKYYNLFETKEKSLLGELAAFDIEFKIRCKSSPSNINLVIAASDAENGSVYYDFIPVKWIRKEWNGESFKSYRPVQLPEEAEILKCYLYNPDLEEFDVEPVQFMPLTLIDQ